MTNGEIAALEMVTRGASTRASICVLPDRRRVHMHDGPMDLIVEAFGDAGEVSAAYRAAAKRFVTVLDELCAELAFLRQPARVDSPVPNGRVAQRMLQAVRPYAAKNFITPMAAVAGAVAEEILAAMTATASLERAYVNDGGDIALHLTSGENFAVGMIDSPERSSLFGKSLFGTATITFDHPVRGIATSGWRGRSFSLGIADAVAVLADTAPMADAAATMIANAVDLPGHPAIRRTRACDLAPDSDLGERLVTQSVAKLSEREICDALTGGIREAESLRTTGLIHAVAINLQGDIRIVGDAAASIPILIPSMSGSLIHA